MLQGMHHVMIFQVLLQKALSFLHFGDKAFHVISPGLHLSISKMKMLEQF